MYQRKSKNPDLWCVDLPRGGHRQIVESMATSYNALALQPRIITRYDALHLDIILGGLASNNEL